MREDAERGTVTLGEGGLDDRLWSAVRAGDAEAVRDLLDRGADPDATGENELTVLCDAVAAYDAPVAESVGFVHDGGE
jgi:ankyrin repeat protein